MLRRRQLELLFDHAPIGVYFVDADFRIQEVNAAAEEVFSDFTGGVIGRDFSEVLRTMWGRERAAEVMRVFRKTFETGEPYHVPEFAEERADRGEIEYYDWRCERIVAPDGRYGVACYFMDISRQVHAKQAIAASEERYRTLFGSIGQGFCVLELILDEAEHPIDYRYIEANPAFEHQSGLADVVGRTAREVLSDPEPIWLEHYGRVALLGESIRVVEYSTTLGRWFDVNAFRIGEPRDRRIAVLFTDVTEQKAAESALLELTAESDRQRRLYETILSNTPDLVYVFDLHYRFTFANRALLDMWGRSWEASIGKRLLEVGYEPWHAEMHEREIDQVVATKKSVRGEVAFPHATLGKRIYDYIFVPVLDEAGDVESVAGTTRDITEIKEAEEALRTADRRKDEFLATLGHELRNPLAAVRSAMDVLRTGVSDPEQAPELMTIMERQTSQLVRLIDDLLDVSRISLGKVRLERERIDVTRVVEEAAADIRALCRQGGIELTASLPAEPLVIDADPIRIAQVVSNLLNNACKFTPRGGEIRVGVEKEGDEAVVRVSDSGVGIPAEDLSRIFDLLAQVERRRHPGHGGLGIGLWLARTVTEMHGGSIEARSGGPGAGSEFLLRLPFAPPLPGVAVGEEEGGAADGAAKPADERRLRIVTAEDNRDVLYVIGLMLEMGGHEVETAVDGLEALEKIRMHRPQVALLDIGMPGMNGYEVARSVRREPWGDQVFLIAMTGWGEEKDKRAAREAGFDVHLTKPVDLNRIDEILQRSVATMGARRTGR